MSKISRWLFGVSFEETKLTKRKFAISTPEKQKKIESIGNQFLIGYHKALQVGYQPKLISCLENQPLDFKGFSYEGAAMGLSILDFFRPFGKKHFKTFLDGEGNGHVYMAYVGLGWAIARLPVRPESAISKHDRLLKWLAIDGYGFHQAYFKTKKYVYDHKLPTQLSETGLHVFYQGLGRCLWFVYCADPFAIGKAVKGFPEKFHPDIWSGLGLASTYAGEINEKEIQDLIALSGNYLPQLAQGAAFAAKARIRAGNLLEYNQWACQQICRTDAQTAAIITDTTQKSIHWNNGKEPFLQWKELISQHISKKLL